MLVGLPDREKASATKPECICVEINTYQHDHAREFMGQVADNRRNAPEAPDLL